MKIEQIQARETGTSPLVHTYDRIISTEPFQYFLFPLEWTVHRRDMNKLKTFDMIVAAGRNGEIGYKGHIPWPMLRLDKDMALCKSNTCVVSRAEQI